MRENSRFFVWVGYAEEAEADCSGSPSSLRNTFSPWLTVYCFSLPTKHLLTSLCLRAAPKRAPYFGTMETGKVLNALD